MTRKAAGHPSLQLNHLMNSWDMLARISDVKVEDIWDGDGHLNTAGLADHAPIWFALHTCRQS